MSQIEKLVGKILETKTDIRFTDLAKVLTHMGYERARQKGSHVHFRKQGAPSLTIPVHSGHVRKVYVAHIIKLLDL